MGNIQSGRFGTRDETAIRMEMDAVPATAPAASQATGRRDQACGAGCMDRVGHGAGSVASDLGDWTACGKQGCVRGGCP